MKYECLTCGHEFPDSEALTVTTYGMGIIKATDSDACPECNSTDIYEVEPDKAELRGEYWGDVERGN